MRLIFLSALILFTFFTSAQQSTIISQLKDGVTFTFEVSCDNGPCVTGQFVNGDYWVVPVTPGGKVKILSISPNGEENGAMLNPDLLRDGEGKLLPLEEQKQGLLNVYDHYDPGLNIMNSLPVMASGGQSIYKIKAQFEGCGTRAIEPGCVSTATVLTVLSEVPENNGASFFRPPFYGSFKPLFTTEKVDLTRLPTLPQVSDGSQGIIGGEDGFEKWTTPQVELYHEGFGEFHRATIPHLAQPPYASDQMNDYLRDLASLFGRETEEEKRMATYSLIQLGIDHYGMFKIGVPFSSGAGQHVGKKPAIAFFAAMYDSMALTEEIRAVASNPEYLEKRFFQEDSQIRMGESGMVIWGDVVEPDFGSIHWYFSRLYPNLDSNGTLGDPYGYIDGPAGGIHPDESQTRDRNYMTVVGGIYIGYSLLQHLMPWYKYAAGDDEILKWSDRVYTGYGVDDFDGGMWTLPDPVAPYDPSESEDCAPFRLYSTGVTNCDLYGETWGPNLEDLSQFIGHGEDPMTHGRMPELHGTKINFTRMQPLVLQHWETLRPCSDPSNPAYPCEGLGSLPENTITAIEDNPIVAERIWSLALSEDRFIFSSRERHEKISLKIYNLNGQLLTEHSGQGTSISTQTTNGGGIYIYVIESSLGTERGKFLITQ